MSKIEQNVKAPSHTGTDFSSAMKRSMIDVSSNRQKTRKSTFKTDKSPFGNGTFGSHITPFAFSPYLAGGFKKKAVFNGILRMEALKNVSFSEILFRAWAVFVPHYRVWDKVFVEQFFSQRKDAFGAETVVIPRIRFGAYGQNAPTTPSQTYLHEGVVTDSAGGNAVPFHRHRASRSSILSNYLGALPSGYLLSSDALAAGSVNALILRGYKALCNDIFRDRTTVPEYREYTNMGDSIVLGSAAPESASYTMNGTTLLQTSWASRMLAYDDPEFRSKTGSGYDTRQCHLLRSPSEKNYQNNRRTNVYSNDGALDVSRLYNHIVGQNLVAEYRSRAENENKTDAEIIAEIRGSRPPKENQCLIIGEQRFPIKIALQPQTSENDSLVLGAEGAISFCPFVLDFDLNFVSNVDGYIHYVYDIVSADGTRFEHELDREWFKVAPNDFYRPDVAIIKDDEKYIYELTGFAHYWQNGLVPTGEVTGTAGFHRRYSEYTKVTSFVRGDMISYIPEVSNWGVRSSQTGLYAHSADGTAVRMTNKTSYHTLANAMEMWQAYAHNKKDYLDYNIRRNLLSDGTAFSSLLNHMAFQNTANQTFWFGGQWWEEQTLPIDDTIDNNLSRVADETSSQWT